MGRPPKIISAYCRDHSSRRGVPEPLRTDRPIACLRMSQCVTDRFRCRCPERCRYCRSACNYAIAACRAPTLHQCAVKDRRYAVLLPTGLALHQRARSPAAGAGRGLVALQQPVTAMDATSGLPGNANGAGGGFIAVQALVPTQDADAHTHGLPAVHERTRNLAGGIHLCALDSASRKTPTDYWEPDYKFLTASPVRASHEHAAGSPDNAGLKSAAHHAPLPLVRNAPLSTDQTVLHWVSHACPDSGALP